MTDEINNPEHYTKGKIEVFDFIVDQDLPWEAGNIIKYLCRYRYKGTPLKDLKKAQWYVNRLVEQMEKVSIE